MSIPRVEVPPGNPTPYIVPGHQGESMTIPGTKTAIRILASAKETNGLFAVFKYDGVLGDAPGFHYHNEAHDIFMCTKGSLKVWAGDKCRILSPGDFCSVPPGVIHQPQLLGVYNESLGLVTPGAWVDFFRFVSDNFDGVLADESDDRNTRAHFGSKFLEIKEKYDVVFQPQHQGCEVGDWTEEDSIIPDGVEPYYLRANSGPVYMLGGILSRPFITTKQSGGQFAITSIESSNAFGNSILSRPFAFTAVHQVYFVLDGAVEIMIDGKANLVRAGETVFIPAGAKLSIEFLDKFVRFWSLSSGDGLEALISGAGTVSKCSILPSQAADVDIEKINAIARTLKLQI